MKQKPFRVLVTGGFGFVGSHVVYKLVNLGYSVDVLDNRRTFILANAQYAQQVQHYKSRLHQGLNNYFDVCTSDCSSIDKIVSNGKYNAIIHLAAMPLATVAIQSPSEAFNVIINGTRNLLDSLRNFSTETHLINISSSMVYGNFINDSASENHPCEPLEIYGSFKRAAELMCQAYANTFGINSTVVRPTAVYGFGDTNRRVVQTFLENAMNGIPLKIFDDKTSKLDFTHVLDLAEAICRVTISKPTGFEVYNFSASSPRTVTDVAEIIKEKIPKTKIITRENTENFRPKRGKLDTSKFIKKFGVWEMLELEKGIEITINQYKCESIES
tara:strand:+ start:4582 stop:5568 length:987 start_codon:yes stop_codon:yes gene_type:complete